MSKFSGRTDFYDWCKLGASILEPTLTPFEYIKQQDIHMYLGNGTMREVEDLISEIHITKPSSMVKYYSHFPVAAGKTKSGEQYVILSKYSSLVLYETVKETRRKKTYMDRAQKEYERLKKEEDPLYESTDN